MRLLRPTTVLLVAVFAAGAARGDDLDRAQGTRDRVNSEIDAIRFGGVTPSNACLSALGDMHTTEDQLTDLGGDTSNAPSGSATLENRQGALAVARDVLASDMEVARDACLADAMRACAGTPAGKLAKPCAALAAPEKKS